VVVPLTEQQKRYKAENREKIKAYMQGYHKRIYAAKSEQYKERSKKFRQEHSEEYKAMMRDYYRNRDKVKTIERRREWRKKNAEKVREYARKFRIKNRLRIRSHQNKYEALKAKATVNMAGIKEWMIRVGKLTTIRCYYCNRVTQTTDIHFDHIIALANGGSHSIENLCVTCPTCNFSKGDRPIRAWIKMGQQVLEL